MDLLSTPAFSDEDSSWDFDEILNANEMAFSDEDCGAIEIVNHTIKTCGQI